MTIKTIIKSEVEEVGGIALSDFSFEFSKRCSLLWLISLSPTTREKFTTDDFIEDTMVVMTPEEEQTRDVLMLAILYDIQKSARARTTSLGISRERIGDADIRYRQESSTTSSYDYSNEYKDKIFLILGINQSGPLVYKYVRAGN